MTTSTERYLMSNNGVPISIQEMTMPDVLTDFAGDGGLESLVGGDRGLWMFPDYVAPTLVVRWYLKQGHTAMVVSVWDLLLILDDHDDDRDPFGIDMLVLLDVQDEGGCPVSDRELRRIAGLVRYRVDNKKPTIIHTHVEKLDWWPAWFHGYVNKHFDRKMMNV